MRVDPAVRRKARLKVDPLIRQIIAAIGGWRRMAGTTKAERRRLAKLSNRARERNKKRAAKSAAQRTR